MCIYIYIYVYVHMYIDINTHICMCVQIHIHIHMFMWYIQEADKDPKKKKGPPIYEPGTYVTHLLASLAYIIPIVDAQDLGKYMFEAYPSIATGYNALFGSVAGIYNGVPFLPFAVFFLMSYICRAPTFPVEVCICIHINMHLYLYIHICYVYMYVHLYIYIYVNMFLHTCIRAYRYDFISPKPSCFLSFNLFLPWALAS
jgi:hypothetical protein